MIGEVFMQSTATEQLQPLLPLLARMLGHRPSPATVWRWTVHGIKTGDRRVKLHSTKIGGRAYASHDDVQRFIDAQNRPEAHDVECERSAETEQRLQRAGLL